MGSPVLIETYWNVKNGFRKIKLMSTGVLIETYWNVKRRRRTLVTTVLSINRNILECKGFWLLFFRSGLLVLIETYWNVKH